MHRDNGHDWNTKQYYVSLFTKEKDAAKISVEAEVIERGHGKGED